MKYWLIYMMCFVTSSMAGQSGLNDTIRIAEVVINSKLLPDRYSGYNTEHLDSSALRDYTHLSLSEVLPALLNIPVEDYGIGGTASVSMRGTDAAHTLVTWNGVDLGNPMPGQSDLSLIAAGMTDDIYLYPGGASMLISNGATGGLLNLVTKPLWDRAGMSTIDFTSGSFGTYSALLNVRAGNSKVQSVTKAAYFTSENNYRYLNSYNSVIPEWETRHNSQVTRRNFMQELYFRRKNSTASARIWYESANRNLPSSMLTVQGNNTETQFDESLRALQT